MRKIFYKYEISLKGGRAIIFVPLSLAELCFLIAAAFKLISHHNPALLFPFFIVNLLIFRQTKILE